LPLNFTLSDLGNIFPSKNLQSKTGRWLRRDACDCPAKLNVTDLTPAQIDLSASEALEVESMKRWIVYFKILILTGSFESPLYALPGMRMPCPSQTHQAVVDQWKGMIQTVAIVGVENRYIYPESGYSEQQIKQRFSGTGEFHCGGQAGGANLVLRNGLLALDSHAFFKIDENTGQCLRPLTAAELNNCYFNVIDSKGNVLPRQYHINPATLKMGGRNSAHPKRGGSVCDDMKNVGNDWAVVELGEQVPSALANSYDLFDSSRLKNGRGEFDFNKLNVTVVAAGATNFKKGIVPTICDGGVGYIGLRTDPNGDQFPMHTNSCSSGPGTSGGGVTVPQGDRPAALFGVATWSKDKTYDGIEYGNKNFTAGTVIDGAFREAILSCQVRCPTTD
jgi:hypothetical protein